MPHSKNPAPKTTNKMSQHVNGDAPSSAFLSHLISYPVISDSIHTFQSHPLGAKSLSLTNRTYQTFAQPLLPYLSQPYAYISPYVHRADSLGDSTLSNLESKFPTLKKPTNEFIEDGKKAVWFPVQKGNEGKEYVFGVYHGESKKVGGQGLLSFGKAALATGLVVGSDAVGWLQGLMRGAKEDVKEGAGQAREQANKAGNAAREQANQMGKEARDGAEKAGDKARETAKEAKEHANAAGEKLRN